MEQDKDKDKDNIDQFTGDGEETPINEDLIEIKNILTEYQSKINKCMSAITTNQKYISEINKRVEMIEDNFKLLLEEKQK